ESSQYPTAWLDLDGNERAAIQLRNSDLNKIHILLLQPSRHDLSPAMRRAAANYLQRPIDRRRAAWTRTSTELQEELAALKLAENEQRNATTKKHGWTQDEKDRGEDKVALRNQREVSL